MDGKLPQNFMSKKLAENLSGAPKDPFQNRVTHKKQTILANTSNSLPDFVLRSQSKILGKNTLQFISSENNSPGTIKGTILETLSQSSLRIFLKKKTFC